MSKQPRARVILLLNTIAFAVCFAAWMLNGVLVTFLIDRGLFAWSQTEMGVLIATPVLTGALMRLPVGMLCDRYGGRIVYFLLMLAAAVPMYLVGLADSYPEFLLLSLGFGLAGASFAAGVAYTSVWFPQERIGTALGIFGMGNAGAAATVMLAPSLLARTPGDRFPQTDKYEYDEHHASAYPTRNQGRCTCSRHLRSRYPRCRRARPRRSGSRIRRL